MEKFTISNGVAVRYADFGKGQKAILLLHGYLEAMEVWDEFAGLLGKNYHIIMLDLPGSGMSDWGNKTTISLDFMAVVAADILSKAQVDQCTVIGHSMGGYVALSLAEQFPEKVERLILLHSTPNADSEEKKVSRKREIELIEAGKKELLANVNPSRGFAAVNIKRCSEQIEELRDQVMMTEDEAIIATLNGMMERRDLNDFFDKMSQPKLMIFGDDDNYIPREIALNLAQMHPTSKVAWVEKAGHMSFVEQPAIVVGIIDDFLKD